MPMMSIEETRTQLEELKARAMGAASITTRPRTHRHEWIPAVERWRSLVELHFRARDVETALRIINCESRGDSLAANTRSSARGLWQHLERYWEGRSTRAGIAGADIFDPVASTIVAAYLRYDAGGWTHWTCY